MRYRPKFYRDPVHGQIRYDSTDLGAKRPPRDAQKRNGWLLRRLIDTPEFQRLRHIRQNGLANFVFHGAEHSRFSHSMGVAHLAAEMYDRIVRNMGESVDDERRLLTSAAALLHDIGHGPFSHTIEEILRDSDIPFDHERLSERFIEEDGSSVAQTLQAVGKEFPSKVAVFIDKKRRKKDHWTYRLVSSQLDADRLDYLLRDAKCAGLQGYGFDLPRLLDMLQHLDGIRIAVDRRAIEAVEGYLLSLDQMYRAVYFHHTVRAGNCLLSSVLRRAFELHKRGRCTIPKKDMSGRTHPLYSLFSQGLDIDLEHYARLGEYHLWVLIEAWQANKDHILSDLSRRLMARRLFKTIEVDPTKYRDLQEIKEKAKRLALRALDHVDVDTVGYYVSVDEPSRTSYKRYDWRREAGDESIWIVGGLRPP